MCVFFIVIKYGMGKYLVLKCLLEVDCKFVILFWNILEECGGVFIKFG